MARERVEPEEWCCTYRDGQASTVDHVALACLVGVACIWLGDDALCLERREQPWHRRPIPQRFQWVHAEAQFVVRVVAAALQQVLALEPAADLAKLDARCSACDQCEQSDDERATPTPQRLCACSSDHAAFELGDLDAVANVACCCFLATCIGRAEDLWTFLCLLDSNETAARNDQANAHDDGERDKQRQQAAENEMEEERHPRNAGEHCAVRMQVK